MIKWVKWTQIHSSPLKNAASSWKHRILAPKGIKLNLGKFDYTPAKKKRISQEKIQCLEPAFPVELALFLGHVSFPGCKKITSKTLILLWMAEILDQLIGSLSHYLQGFFTLVQDFFHQQYEPVVYQNSVRWVRLGFRPSFRGNLWFLDRGSWNEKKNTAKIPKSGESWCVQKSLCIYPPRELTYPTWGKGKSSSKVPWYGIC